jgi:hypothetical protein
MDCRRKMVQLTNHTPDVVSRVVANKSPIPNNSSVRVVQKMAYA